MHRCTIQKYIANKGFVLSESGNSIVQKGQFANEDKLQVSPTIRAVKRQYQMTSTATQNVQEVKGMRMLMERLCRVEILPESTSGGHKGKQEHRKLSKAIGGTKGLSMTTKLMEYAMGARRTSTSCQDRCYGFSSSCITLVTHTRSSFPSTVQPVHVFLLFLV